MPTGTSGDDVFVATGAAEAFDGGTGTDTVSYATSTSPVYADLATGQSTPILKIMPFGDSITYGVISSGTVKNEQSGGYRLYLWNDLQAEDVKIDFVGSMKSGPTTFDRDNSGYRGETAEYLNTIDEGLLAKYTPDAVLLMIGTNDTADDNAATMISELHDLIVSMGTASPNTTIFVAGIPPMYDSARNAIAQDYNSQIPGLVDQLDGTYKVVFVDTSDLTLADITPPPGDVGVHPTAQGHEKLATDFFDALNSAIYDQVRDTFTSIENLTGSAYADTLVGDDGANVLSGLAGNDVLTGGNGNDTLDGGVGDDTMTVGTGDDTYVVDSSKDVVVENANEGIDTIDTLKSSYSLANLPNVEKLVYIGTSNAGLTGNALDNYIQGGPGVDKIDGGAGADTMVGGLGSDTYAVDNIGDVIIETPEGGSIDLVKSSVSYTLPDNVERLTLIGTDPIDGTGNDLTNVMTGNSAANHLVGMGGNDTLDGGAGADTLEGNTGNDTYIVDDTGDTVIEAVNEGTDTVKASVTYTLSANVENLTLTGTGAIDGTGNELNNSMSGNDSANTLHGLDGNDTINGLGGNDFIYGGNGNDWIRGGAGADVVQGDAGNDRFDWDSVSDVGLGATRDQVLDFTQGQDRIDFSTIDAKSGTSTNDAFSFIGSSAFSDVAGQLRAEVVHSGTGDFTLIQGDVNGDGVADFELALVGFTGQLHTTDFYL